MNIYTEFKENQQNRMNTFLNSYAFFAFSESQFEEGLQKLGIDKTAAGVTLARIPGGGYMLQEHEPELISLLKAFSEEREKALNDPDTGADFAYYMFYTELCNHEYSYTGDTSETLEALGFTAEEILESPFLQAAFVKAATDAGGDVF